MGHFLGQLFHKYHKQAILKTVLPDCASAGI